MRNLVLIVGLVSLAACGSTHEPQAVSSGGETILSSNPCIDAILVEVADHDRIVSLSHYSHSASSSSMDVQLANRFPSNGGTAEEIIAARPDLALLGVHTPAATLSALERAGINVALIGVPNTIEESLQQIHDIGSATGDTDNAQKLIERIETAVVQKKPEIAVPAPSLLMWQAGGLVPGSGTLIDDIIQQAGFRNASSSYGLAMWDILPLEPVAHNPPDIILTPNSGKSGDSRNLGMRTLYAERFGDRVLARNMPASLLYCGGPTIIEAMDLLNDVKASYVTKGYN